MTESEMNEAIEFARSCERFTFKPEAKDMKMLARALLAMKEENEHFRHEASDAYWEKANTEAFQEIVKLKARLEAAEKVVDAAKAYSRTVWSVILECRWPLPVAQKGGQLDLSIEAYDKATQAGESGK